MCNEVAKPYRKESPSARILWDVETVSAALSRFADELQQLPPIPQRVVRFDIDPELASSILIPVPQYVSWARKFDIDQRNDSLIRFGLQRLKRMNPDWRVIMYDDSDIELELDRWLTSRDAQMMRPKHIVEKTDLWRLLKMYHEGGMYVDIDRLHNKELSTVITHSTTKMLLPIFAHEGVFQDFSQDFMCTAPKNSVFKAAADLNLKRHRIYEGCVKNSSWSELSMCDDGRLASPRDFVAFAGAISYMDALTEHLFGMRITPGPGECASRRILELLDALKPAVVTMLELIPYHTMTYEGTSDEQAEVEYSEAKTAFYMRERVGSWTVQVSQKSEKRR
jgi:hypothetical protein